MANRTYKVEVDYNASWKGTILVELPDNCTEKEAETLVQLRLDLAVDDIMPEDIEVESWDWVEQPAFAPPPQVAFPSDPRLFVEWQGHRWATTGVFAIREDVPCPTGDDPWKEQSASLVMLLDKVQLTLEKPSTMRFQSQFAPILRSGRPTVARFGNIVACGVLHEDGRLKAVVMPYHGSGEAVDCMGKP